MKDIVIELYFKYTSFIACNPTTSIYKGLVNVVSQTTDILRMVWLKRKQKLFADDNNFYKSLSPIKIFVTDFN